MSFSKVSAHSYIQDLLKMVIEMDTVKQKTFGNSGKHVKEFRKQTLFKKKQYLSVINKSILV